jgi:NAD(P)-dependent dehydrogenase (short-subunit alcohol dehydrogenase family)
MTSQPVENKVALITGANKGIGLEIARQLGVQGITVLIGARDEKRGQEAAEKLHSEHNIDARAVQLDVTDHSTIEAAAKHIENEFGKLDILVNNAGIAVDSVPPSQLDIEVCVAPTTLTSLAFSLSLKQCCLCCGSLMLDAL